MSNITLSALIGSDQGYHATDLNNAGQTNVLFGTSSTQLVDAGDLTADVLATIADVTGQGIILVAAVLRNEVSAASVRGKLTVDGVVVSDLTSSDSAINNSSAGTVNVGQVTGNAASLPNAIPIRFNSSFKYEVASGTNRTAGSSLKTYVKYLIS